MKPAAIRLIAVLLLGTAISTPAAAEEDSQIWTTAGVNVGLGGDWRFSEEVIGRFSDNRNGLYEVEASSLLSYKLNKNVTLAAGYVHNPQYAGGDFTIMERRAREQVTWDNLAKVGPGKIGARLRMEQRWREGIDGTGWRVRPYVKYGVPLGKSVTLNLTSEAFFNLNTTAFQRQPGFDRVRNAAAVSTKLNKAISLDVGYLNQYAAVRGGEDRSDHVATVGLSLSL